MGLVVLGHHEEARGAAVEAMDDARAQDTAHPGEVLHEMQQGVDQRPLRPDPRRDGRRARLACRSPGDARLRRRRARGMSSGAGTAATGAGIVRPTDSPPRSLAEDRAGWPSTRTWPSVIRAWTRARLSVRGDARPATRRDGCRPPPVDDQASGSPPCREPRPIRAPGASGAPEAQPAAGAAAILLGAAEVGEDEGGDQDQHDRDELRGGEEPAEHGAAVGDRRGRTRPRSGSRSRARRRSGRPGRGRTSAGRARAGRRRSGSRPATRRSGWDEGRCPSAYRPGAPRRRR